jgi:NAD(P) transhydrogenase subunit alpha
VCSPAPAWPPAPPTRPTRPRAEITDRAGAFGAELVLKVRSPDADELSLMKSRHRLVGMLNPFDKRRLARLAAAGLTSFALEAAPRTTRAQSMDVLSSQANIAGYKAVMMAADKYQRLFMPMLMTAAGTIKAARVVILGVGVAGLQAIATAKRLGAVIEASDVRPSGQGAGRVAGRQVHRRALRDARGEGSREGRRRLRARPMPQSWMTPEGRGRQARGAGRHRDLHRADPRPRRAGADHRGDGQER